ncbi:MAG: hypothetical protein FJ087_19890 [Deltaproteobacteria bacterium]|nr:hypothetical protein [Deltaproteobacteria bacterium]
MAAHPAYTARFRADLVKPGLRILKPGLRILKPGLRIPVGGAIPQSAEGMPNEIAYDEATRRLLVGTGHVENVPPRVWAYEVSGKQVIRQWFSYRKRDRERPLMGDRRPPSRLCDVQPDRWIAEYTQDLMDLLHVLGLLVELEPVQAGLLDRICAGATVPEADLRAAGAFEKPAAAPVASPPRRRRAAHPGEQDIV